MDQVFVDYISKKSDMLDGTCQCGNNFQVFLSSLDQSYITVCRKCGKKVYFVNCTNPQCRSGYAYPESAKEINLIERSWQCPSCKTVYKSLPETVIKNYYKSELPPEVLKEFESRGLHGSSKWLVYGILLLTTVIYIYMEFVKP
jgi:hypothetical protein